MEKPLWKFTDNLGNFYSETAHKINTLYFPLCNDYPIMSSLSWDLHGDLKVDFNSFLLQPVSRMDLNNLKSSRNFWIYINPKKIWSVTGVSKDTLYCRHDRFKLEAGLLWQKITRLNAEIGLRASITSFIPASGEPVEIMRVDITNVYSKNIKFTPTAAIPIFGRSADNLHDHRHVTSLFSRIKLEKFGVAVTPALSFNESGHRKNSTTYFVFGIDEKSYGPEYIHPTQEEFTGTDSDLEAPGTVFNNRLPNENCTIQGQEAFGGLRFKEKTLKPKNTYSYFILMGIANDKKDVGAIFNKFNTLSKIERSFQSTLDYWQKKGSQISINTCTDDFDNWFRWVSIQPTLRRIFGCSFLPDFDYGRGGRGWRDLWQDCLSLILTNPCEVRNMLINNFAGVRIDGSNATIIGDGPGEFISDRNNISRVWMDHGVWPLISTFLYIHQTGDLKILLEEASYFRDHQLCRNKTLDTGWSSTRGKNLKTKDNSIYRGTILEHLLIQNLVQFFNVGPHNHVRLENADWNDGLDMAANSGESVAFSAMYAHNLRSIAEMLEKMGIRNVALLKELTILLDTLGSNPIDYALKNEKIKILERYFQATKYTVSGKKTSISTPKLIRDLKIKADWISGHIRKTEWLKEGFFNGYYNNDKHRIEGRIKARMQMTLSGQTFPIMSGIANKEQIGSIYKNAVRYLRDKNLGGFHLNTDFKQEQLNLGRAFSFVYGDKENGAFFNHMAVMFAYALYKSGYAREGWDVLSSTYLMSVDAEKSKIYPGLPEYFNAEGRGMYSYLTGSASWFVFTLLTQVFGVRGEYGDLIIEPKLTAGQFKFNHTIAITTYFAGKRLEVSFKNLHRKDFGRYLMRQIRFNGKIFASGKQSRFFISRQEFLALAKKEHNTLAINLD